MEKKTKQQIIGILVVVALVIIVLPLLFGKNNNEIESVSIAPPPFPDQQGVAQPEIAQQNETPTEAKQVDQPTPSISENAAPINNTLNEPNTVAETTDQPPTEKQAEQIPAEASATPVVTEPQPSQQAVSNTASTSEQITKPTEDTLTTSSDTLPTPKKTHLTTENRSLIKHTKQTHHVIAKNIHSSFNEKISTNAWIIQLGSFKNKENATRLTNKLRSAGYKAFVHETFIHGSPRMNVYIGPENSRAKAKILSAELEQKTTIHGIVMHYKPLEL